MVVTNKHGREIEIDRVTGSYEEPVIESCGFLQGDDEPTDADLDYIYETYFAELSEEAMQYQVGRAEAWADAPEDR